MNEQAKQYVEEFMNRLIARNPGEPEFHQAVQEVLRAMQEGPLEGQCQQQRGGASDQASDGRRADGLHAPPGEEQAVSGEHRDGVLRIRRPYEDRGHEVHEGMDHGGRHHAASHGDGRLRLPQRQRGLQSGIRRQQHRRQRVDVNPGDEAAEQSERASDRGHREA